MKVVVTGSTGKFGREVVKDLLGGGHSVLGLDKARDPGKLAPSWVVDLSRAADAFEALVDADAVVHLAAYPAPNLVPDSETFNNNVTATYNVMNAAFRMGVKRVVLASSIAAFGLIYASRVTAPDYLPLDENHPCRPQDPYGLSKVVAEKMADSFVQKSEMSVCSFRFPGLINDYSVFPSRWKDPAEGKKRLWTYIDLRDAVTAVRLGLMANLRGHEVFTVSAAGSHHDGPTDELVAKFYPGVRVTRPRPDGNWPCMDNSKAERVLGFQPRFRWEDSMQT